MRKILLTRIEFEADSKDVLSKNENESAHDDSMVLLSHRQYIAQTFSLVIGFICVVSSIFTCNYYNIQKRGGVDNYNNNYAIEEYRGIFSRVPENSRECLFFGSKDIDGEGLFTRIIAAMCFVASITLIVLSIIPINKKASSLLPSVAIRNQHLNLFVTVLSSNIFFLISLILLMSRSKIGCGGVHQDCNIGFGYVMMMLSVIIYSTVFLLHFLMSWKEENSSNDSFTKMTFDAADDDDDEMRYSYLSRVNQAVATISGGDSALNNGVRTSSNYTKSISGMSNTHRKSIVPRQNMRLNYDISPLSEKNSVSEVQKTQTHPDGSQSIVKFEVIQSSSKKIDYMVRENLPSNAKGGSENQTIDEVNEEE